MSERYFIQSVAHAAALLRAFQSPSDVLRPCDIVALTGLSKGVVFRLVYTLEKTGFIEAVAPNHYRTTIHQRKQGKYKIGYAAQGTDYQFSQEVTNSLRREADRSESIELLVLSNKYSQKTAIKNADMFIREGVDLVIEFQTDEIIAPILSAKYSEAKIPQIAVEIPHPGAVYFGANNYQAGLIAGRALGRWAKQAWEGEIDEILLVELARAGHVPKARIMGELMGIREVLAGSESVPVVYLDGDGQFEQSWKVVRKHLRSSAARRTLVGAINDTSAIGALRAYEEAGRGEECAVIGQNASPEGRAEMRRSPRFIGSVAFFPERYGEGLLRLALDILSFRPTPPAVFVAHQLVTARTVDQVYPSDQVLAEAHRP